jgi:hypothetical protein
MGYGYGGGNYGQINYGDGVSYTLVDAVVVADSGVTATLGTSPFAVLDIVANSRLGASLHQNVRVPHQPPVKLPRPEPPPPTLQQHFSIKKNQ